MQFLKPFLLIMMSTGTFFSGQVEKKRDAGDKIEIVKYPCMYRQDCIAGDYSGTKVAAAISVMVAIFCCLMMTGYDVFI